MNTPRPTPETDTRFRQAGMAKTSLADFARRLERERDEAREALSGRTVSCSQCNEAAKQIEAMRVAIKEAHDALDNCVEFIQDAQIIEAQWRWEPVKQSKAVLDKLQPFLP